MRGIRILPEETNIDFIGKRLIAFALSAVIIVSSIVLVSVKGLNFGIDFTGGTVIEVRVPEPPDLGEMRTMLNTLELGAVSIQEFGEPTDLMIRIPEQLELPEAREERLECLAGTTDASNCPRSPQQLAIDKVRESLDGRFGDEVVDYRRTEYVGPQVGDELKKAGLMAVIWSLLGILGYIWFRFEWQFGVAAIIALAHDTIAIIGLFALTQMEFNLSTVAALLMIAGYSINDTVVVFDRIRENLRKYKKKLLPDLFNMSVNQMLSRTLMTSVTTLLALAALWLFGGEVIRGFVDALIAGIVIGTYSSVFVASPVLIYMNIRRDKPETEDVSEQPQSQAG